ncbi:hypothetical protein [Burkholderia pseudomultivorans]|uniref:Uncharacterized protein n=2 Tax=Burkholderia cepacia complex TaxID=87882 RepID=A0AAN0RRX4_9BURK|nr:hypothetical protein [Burkholderia pseudomultivorans]AIO32847.1 hypothetical protein DM39_2994 [Burkholderia cenocepacia]AOI93475.1 hypothetical protein WS57_33295 [Burkholderia pseudomultivorans]KVC38793.1 hypothetical protein WS55_26110 [Burkholderia pseudomultivorans]KVC41275.1 hypothetical protein WS56_32680 [Burkholderia pseudomultivorans]KVC54933.1 hypothetical protein WS58_31355 [Burkholderia pseudomultivorans]
MLRWLIAVLFLANLLAAALANGLFGPLPAAGPREPGLLSRQVQPDALHAMPLAQAVDQPVVGGPIAPPGVDTEPLAAPAH